MFFATGAIVGNIERQAGAIRATEAQCKESESQFRAKALGAFREQSHVPSPILPPARLGGQHLPHPIAPSPCGDSTCRSWASEGEIRNWVPCTTPTRSMKTASGPGDYRTQSPTHLIGGADTHIGFLSRLWKRRIQGDIQRRNDNISKQFPDAGWKNLPQELVDEILRYLLDDLPSLKACSLTCKHLFGLTRPLIHQRLVCPGSRPGHPKPKVSLFGRHKKDPGAFERLIDADRSGVLHYTRHLIFKPKRYGPDPYFKPNDLQEYLPHLRSVSNLHTLTIQSFYIPRFIPVFNEYFGTSTNTLRRLDMRGSFATGRQLLYILCQFPLLEDLTIVYPYWEPPTWEPPTWNPPPMITQIPPLRGKLVLVGEGSRELFEGLTAFPVKLNFRSLELFRCMGAAHVVLAACARTATSVSYFWHRQDDQS